MVEEQKTLRARGRASRSKWRAVTGSALASVVTLLTVFGLTVIGLGQAAAAQEVDGAVSLVTVETSCVNGLGRLDITLTNTATQELPVTVGIDAVLRDVAVGAGQDAVVTITGRSGGTRALTLNAMVVAEVEIDCDFLVDRSDNLAAAAMNVYRLDENGPVARLFGQASALTLEPGEPTDCVSGEGTVWQRVAARAELTEVTTRFDIGVGVYRSSVDAPGFGDVELLGCVGRQSSDVVETVPGETLWIQASGRRQNRVNLAEVRPIEDMQSPVEVVDFSNRCLANRAIVSTTVTNPSAETVTVHVYPESLRSGQTRSLVLAPGETVTSAISGRADGLYQLFINGLRVRNATHVACAADSPNDDIATAEELAFVNGLGDPEPQRFTYSHTQEEIDRFAAPSDDSDCMYISTAGSWWYSFVAEDEVAWVDGSDDQRIGIFESSVEAPAALADLDKLACGDAERIESIRTIPGQRYWVVASGDRADFKVFNRSAPSNDDLVDARVLDGIDVVPAVGATLEADELDGCGSDRPTLWWKWTADRADLNEAPLKALARSLQFGRSQPYAIWSAESEQPTLGDLTLVGCRSQFEAPDPEPLLVEPGRTYWIQIAPNKKAELILGDELGAIDVDTSVVCSDAGMGTAKWIITNRHAFPLRVDVQLADRSTGRTLRKSVTVPGNDQATVRISGRRDGGYSYRATGGLSYSFGDLDVACSQRDGDIDVAASCLGGRGRIDVWLDNQLDGGFYVVNVSKGDVLLERSAYVFDIVARVTVTGRVNGSWNVEVIREDTGETVFAESAIVDC